MFHPVILDVQGIKESLRQEWVCRVGIFYIHSVPVLIIDHNIAIN